MNIFVNGKIRSVKSPLLVQELLDLFDIDPQVIVVEIDQKIIDRNQYQTTLLKENNRVELIRFMGGG